MSWGARRRTGGRVGRVAAFAWAAASASTARRARATFARMKLCLRSRPVMLAIHYAVEDGARGAAGMVPRRPAKAPIAAPEDRIWA